MLTLSAILPFIVWNDRPWLGHETLPHVVPEKEAPPSSAKSDRMADAPISALYTVASPTLQIGKHHPPKINSWKKVKV